MRISFNRSLHITTILFLLILPKSGILVGSIPIYLSTLWGTFLVILCASNALKTSPKLAKMYFLMAFFAAVSWLFNMLELPRYSFGITAQMIFNLTAILALSIAFYPIKSAASLATFLKAFKLGYYAIILYGALQVVFGAETVAIKNVTATYAVSFSEILERYNVLQSLSDDTNVVSKIFSTYQNGNLFGIAIVLCLPVALTAEKNLVIRLGMFGLTGVICIFTASAGAMVGLSVVMFFYILQAIRLGKIPREIGVALTILPFAAIVYLVVYGLPSQFEALITTRLLNRDFSSNLRWIKVGMWWQELGENPILLLRGSLVPTSPPVFEVLPIALMQFYGIVVAFSFYIVFFLCMDFRNFHAYKIGVLSYFFMSIADGGLWLTPTPYLLALNIAACRAMDYYPTWPTYMRQTHFTWRNHLIASV